MAPKVPSEQGALNVPVYPVGQEAVLLAPLAALGRETFPYAVETVFAGQLLGAQVPLTGPKAPNVQVELTVPVYPVGQEAELTAPFAVLAKATLP